ncbi:MAG: ankyrin repeat domain-containing protein [Epsilonproteobacteria bacterium]|nr:ankyrin repeat domain-containing protein [Campylobacterota bacterium]
MYNQLLRLKKISKQFFGALGFCCLSVTAMQAEGALQEYKKHYEELIELKDKFDQKYSDKLEKLRDDAELKSIKDAFEKTRQQLLATQDAAQQEYNQQLHAQAEESKKAYAKEQDLFEALVSTIVVGDQGQFDAFFASNPEFDVNTKDPIGFTPLHYAAAMFNVEAAKKLLEKGADINAAAGMFGYTPLDGTVDDCSWNRLVIKDAEQDLPDIISSQVFHGQGPDGRVVIAWANDDKKTAVEDANRDQMVKLLEEHGGKHAQVVSVFDFDDFFCDVFC